MHGARNVAAVALVLSGATLSVLLLADLAMFSPTYLLPLLFFPFANSQQANVDLSWHAPNTTWINTLSSVINGTGIHGFIFNSSQLPPGTKYGTYSWCNMPHVKREEYPVADKQYELEYVEVVSG